MNKFTREQAFEKTLEYFNGDELATQVWVDKYALKNQEGTEYYEETPSDTFDRLADAFYEVEKNYPNAYSKEQIRNMFSDESKTIRLIPGGSVLAGLGDPNYIGSLSNCLVVASPDDSYSGIMKSREERVQLMKRRCGVGVDISSLRPAGAIVNNPAKSSTGPVSFMDVDSGLTQEVAQSGRRGALMITMSCNHPDILDFIKKKQDLTKVTGANISVQLTNDFMEAVKNDTDYILRWPVDIHIRPEEYNDLPYNQLEVFEIQCGKVYLRKIKARDYWKELIHCAWNTGEPGIMFKDIHLENSPETGYQEYRGITTNPCGEIFMEAYDSCRLIACNLSAFVKNKYTKEAYFDFDEFKNAVKIGMHISDDLVDAESKCVERIIKNIDPKSTTELELWTKIRDIGIAGRRCGFGITALGDMLAMLGLKFDSQEALDMVDKVMNTKFTTEVEVEIELGQERGVFKGFSKDKEVSSKFSKKLFEIVGKDLWEKYTTLGRRNISWSTVAPTGSLSILTQTTSGIEPIFSPYYIRRKKCGLNDRVDFVDKNGQGFSEFLVIHHGLVDWFRIVGKELSEKLGLDYKEDMQYKFEEMNKIFEFSPWFQSTANDIDWGKRVDIQSIIQRYITHSISSTVNLPNSATEEDVSNIYLRAYDKDLKGITVYRDGCRDGVLVTTKEDCGCGHDSLTHNAPKRPKILPCDVKRFRNNKEKWIAFVGLYDDNEPYEIFTGMAEKIDEIPDDIETGEIIRNKIDKKTSRYDFRYTNSKGEKVIVEGINQNFNPTYNGYGRLISSCLRHGMPIEYLMSTIKAISFDEETINSWKNGILRVLAKYAKQGDTGEICPECGVGHVIRENGCKHCDSCSWSACG